MESEAGNVDWEAKRVRIEHGGGLLPDLISRARDLGVVVVQNPTHFAFNDIFAERYGEMSHKYSPARSLIEAGIPFALGSDGPLNPFLNLMFAVMHPARPEEANYARAGGQRLYKCLRFRRISGQGKGYDRADQTCRPRGAIARHLQHPGEPPSGHGELNDNHRRADRLRLGGAADCAVNGR